MDRFGVRLYAERKGRATLYRFRVRLLYDRDERSAVSQPLTVALPSAPEIDSPKVIHRRLKAFQQDAERAGGSDREWLSTLSPDDRARVETDLDDPHRAIARCLDEEERTLRRLVELATLPGTCDPGLLEAVQQAQLTLSYLPPIREEFLPAG